MGWMFRMWGSYIISRYFISTERSVCSVEIFNILLLKKQDHDQRYKHLDWIDITSKSYIHIMVTCIVGRFTLEKTEHLRWNFIVLFRHWETQMLRWTESRGKHLTETVKQLTGVLKQHMLPKTADGCMCIMIDNSTIFHHSDYRYQQIMIDMRQCRNKK